MKNKNDYSNAVTLFNSLLFSCTTDVSQKNYRNAQKSLEKALKLLKYLPKLHSINEKQNNTDFLKQENVKLTKGLNESKNLLNKQKNVIDELNKSILNQVVKK